MKRVQDEVAIITGAANGLGQAIAFRLAQDGANVILGDIDGSGLSTTASEIRKTGSQVITVVGDITEEAQAQELIDAALNHFGKIDILVNNVGGSRNSKIWEMEVEDWDYTVRLNLRGTFLCTKAAVRHMIKKKKGSILCLPGPAKGLLGRLIIRVVPPIQHAKQGSMVLCAPLLWSWQNLTFVLTASHPAPLRQTERERTFAN